MITPEERNRIVEENLGLATHFAEDYAASRMEFEDLVQEARLGLIDAAERFDPKRGTKFSTYARWHILKRIMDAIHNRNEIVRVPRRRPSHICASLNDDDAAEIQDDSPTVESMLDESAMVDRVRLCIGQLPPREAIVIRLRHGVNTEKMTLVKVAAVLGVSRERVRQIQASAEEKLRALLSGRAILTNSGADGPGTEKRADPNPNPKKENDGSETKE